VPQLNGMESPFPSEARATRSLTQPSQKQESPAAGPEALPPGSMAGTRPMPSFRAIGSEWFRSCWQQEIAAIGLRRWFFNRLSNHWASVNAR
jgi:hypothetical protein